MIFVCPEKSINAETVYNEYSVYAINSENDDMRWIEFTHIYEEIPTNIKEEFIAKKVFESYFNEGHSYYVPKNVEINSLYYENGHLYLNISSEVLNYGGNFHENILKAEITRNALEIENVEKFTLLIDNKVGLLTEGGSIISATKESFDK